MTSAQRSDKWTGVGLTDLGLVRKLNQDAFSLENSLQLWVLADGMGGHAGGEVASQIAVKAIPEVVRTQLSTETSLYVQPDKLESLLDQALESANQRIRQAAAEDESLKGMGTTTIVVAITHSPTGYQASVAHAGDSRAYLFRQGTLSLWTKDHTLMEERLALNLITAKQVRTHPLRHVLTKALGIDPELRPTIRTYPLEPLDLILMCSDGLTKMLTDEEIQTIIGQKAPQAEAICRTLVDTANRLGGEDNTTVLLIGLH
ncbi:Stp1/IreP family PP2C-type Ser/Thr phosphatase [Candidatus Nitrospira allomarina]|jgi:PPM family protein phosphatase|uniref:Stp1/IreP family PP2C-type Ser/Thr phosphatase n=1 Tax=Candidatus Nitrospira allomarina TaxID=3020900 RepID=A0AA96GAE6_9BACT|nr:Stp1/IreP family PP2C-type Ser/Thr phosphatase [Candidatus Nitrospira allomarina]WNM57412.1 Stp1/IreP family PP2C-type Ser/Thr phosphatase [Candidatus Nitrospira allomarina]